MHEAKDEFHYVKDAVEK